MQLPAVCVCKEQPTMCGYSIIVLGGCNLGKLGSSHLFTLEFLAKIGTGIS